MRPWTEPACRTLFPLLLPKLRTDGSCEDRRSRQPEPQMTSDGRREASRPHCSTLRIWEGDEGSCFNGQRIERRRCQSSLENCGVLPRDISWPSPGTPLWTSAPQTGTWVWSTLVCTLTLFIRHGSHGGLGNSSCIHLQSWGGWPAYPCFFFPVVSASDKNSSFSSDFSFQLPAAAAAPDQRKWHQNQKVLKKWQHTPFTVKSL